MFYRYRSSSHLVRLLAVAALIVLLVGGGYFLRSNVSASSESRMFMGLRNVAPAQVHQLLPATAARPAVVYFHSKLCLDCKKMAPVLSSALASYPQVVYRKFDILAERDTQQAVFDAFKPVSVPTIVFIAPNGKIQNVLYNYQSAEAIKNALSQLQNSSKQTAGKKK